MATLPSPHADPIAGAAELLGVELEADEQQIHAAYVDRIKEYPPDQDPARFEQIRDAYQLLNDPLSRARQVLSTIDPRAPLESLLDTHRQPARYVGPEPWLAAMRERAQT
jgi:DnaJ-domain-containing protein 1